MPDTGKDGWASARCGCKGVEWAGVVRPRDGGARRAPQHSRGGERHRRLISRTCCFLQGISGQRTGSRRRSRAWSTVWKRPMSHCTYTGGRQVKGKGVREAAGPAVKGQRRARGLVARQGGRGGVPLQGKHAQGGGNDGNSCFLRAPTRSGRGKAQNAHAVLSVFRFNRFVRRTLGRGAWHNAN